MSNEEQFTGLDMQNLIGGPLLAAANAVSNTANSTKQFMDEVGYDANGKVHTASVGNARCTANEDSTSNMVIATVDAPVLAIVPIPDLHIDDVNILFDQEVKESKKSESTTDRGEH